jgi:hypothetical protein
MTQEDSHITGGTGLFTHASGSFTGSVSPQGCCPAVLCSCAAGQPALPEVDILNGVERSNDRGDNVLAASG